MEYIIGKRGLIGGINLRRYQIYLIEDEFAAHYFGKERMFHQLFHEYENSNGDLSHLLKRQIQFITKPIPIFRLQQMIEQKLRRNKHFHEDKGIYYLNMHNGKSTAELTVNQHMMTLFANGTLEAETIFFECIRQCEDSFLAIDLHNERFGWLKPIKERKFV